MNQAFQERLASVDPNQRVIRRGETVPTGVYTGGTRPCAICGCAVDKEAIRWDDGKLTYVCGKGSVEWVPDVGWRIL